MQPAGQLSPGAQPPQNALFHRIENPIKIGVNPVSLRRAHIAGQIHALFCKARFDFGKRFFPVDLPVLAEHTPVDHHVPAADALRANLTQRAARLFEIEQHFIGM